MTPVYCYSFQKKDRKMRIEVGQGLEGSLTDAYSKRIITEVMVPLFREGNVDSGVMLGVRHIVNYAHPELKIAVPENKKSMAPSESIQPIFASLYFNLSWS